MRHSLLIIVPMLAAGVATAQPLAPVAQVNSGTVAWSGSGAPAVRLNDRSVYAGGERFILFDVADCELHVFVDADPARQVRRLYWVQYESYLPARPGLFYDYAATGDRRMNLWRTTIWANASFGSSSEPVRPRSDTERVRMLLAKVGYTLPDSMMNVRFVRLLDDSEETGRGRRELMLIYAEGLTATAADELRRDDRRWRNVEHDLIARAAAAFAPSVRANAP